MEKDSVMLMEIGADQKEFIKEVGEKFDFDVSVLHDYSNHPRLGVFKK